MITVSGTVIHGEKRGRTLGFPTANVLLGPGDLGEPFGVYAAWVVNCGMRYPAAASWGMNPTFDLAAPQLEVHLIDFDGDLYGTTLEVTLVAFIRDELAFDSLAALSDQIAADVIAARKILAAHSS